MNHREDLSRCVRSFLDAGYPNVRITVVDNASTDGSADALIENFPSIEVIRNSRNLGYAAGCNCGIRKLLAGGSDYILISNPDILVEKGFLQHLIAAAEASYDVGVLNPTMRYFDQPEKIYYAAGRMSRMLCTGFTWTRRSASILRAGEPVEVSLINGALALFKRRVFEQAGLLDERFFLYHDDNEFSIRYARDFRLMYVPRSVVYHRSGAGRGWASYTENYLYYYTKYRVVAFDRGSAAYRFYVLLFVMANSLGKAMVIAPTLLSRRARAARQLAALWQGVRDGIGIWAGDRGAMSRRLPAHATEN
jgi:GT2 family glycosyltransferase